MFWENKRRKKVRNSSRAPRQKTRRLYFEGLERREVLAAGVVDVQTLIPAGSLKLYGDLSNNEVDIQQTVNVGEYFIQGKNGTLLSLNGGGVTFPSITVNGIYGDITSDLKQGDDIFRFLGISTGVDSSVPKDLYIYNDDGSDRNTIDHVLINGDFYVTKVTASTGYSELHIIDSTVIGITDVDNTGGAGLTGGDTLTTIDNSWLQGKTGAAPAFELDNGNGKDIIEIQGNSQFGIGPFPPPPNPVIDIDNRDGGSRTTFTGASAVAGFGTTTVYGDLNIYNGKNLPGTLDIVTFNGSNVLGDVHVTNYDGNYVGDCDEQHFGEPPGRCSLQSSHWQRR